MEQPKHQNGLLFTHKKDKILSSVMTLIELEIIILDETSKAQINKYTISHVDSKKVDFIQVDNRMVATRGLGH